MPWHTQPGLLTAVAALHVVPPPSGTTLDPATKTSNATLSNGNLTSTSTGSAAHAKSTTSHDSGHYYLEVTTGTASSGSVGLGLANSTYAIGFSPYLGDDGNSIGYWNDGKIVHVNNSYDVGVIPSWTSGDNVGFDIDLDVGQFRARVNGGTWSSWYSIGNLARQLGGAWIATDVWFVVDLYAGGEDATVNFGASSFAYTAPTGASAWG